MKLSEIFDDQSIICKELVLGEAISENLAVKIDDTTNKLVPADSAEAMVGVAEPVYNGISGYMQPGADMTTRTFVKGIAVCAVSAEVVNGQKLTVDATNPGKLKPATSTDTVVAIALSNSTEKARILLL